MANQLLKLSNLMNEIEFRALEDSEESTNASYEEFELETRRLFFNYIKEQDSLSRHDFHAQQGILGHLRGKTVVFGKYGSAFLTKNIKHKLEGFNLTGMKNLGDKLKYLVRKSRFPIKYSEENSNILKSIYESLDFNIPLRKLVRNMIQNIREEWDVTYSSLYLSALRYVYSVFLAHSDNDTTLSVTGSTYLLLLNPWDQDYIKDYALYQYRIGTTMFPEGEDWISDERFSLIEDEPLINFCTPWDYEVEDYKYAYEPYDSEKYTNELRFLTAQTLEFLSNIKGISSFVDVNKLHRYITDTSFFVPEESLDSTFKKIDKLNLSMLIEEVKNPTIKSFEFIRKQIYVSPNNIRDTFIPSWKTFCALFVLESLCDDVVSRLPEIRIGKVNSNLKFEHNYYVMIDVKKFGIMFPKEVIISTIEVIERMFHLDLSYIKTAYMNYILYVDGKETYPSRGFGLGNMNKLATLAHWAIAKVSGLKFYVYSDDIVYMLDKEPSLDILERFKTFYETFGLVLNTKKCYISNSWEFLGESNHDFFDYVENSRCISLFLEAFFSRTYLEGELKEKAALKIYSECRDLFLKNHEINPILRNDLLLYPVSMGGFVFTNTPLTYCEQGDLEPSTLTSIGSIPEKFIYSDVDSFYSNTSSKVDYYLDSIVRHYHISERRKMSSWKELQWWKSEEYRYKRSRIGNKGLYDILQFGINHQDLPDYLLDFRPSPSQIKTFVKVPSVFRRKMKTSFLPVISVRKSDLEFLDQISLFTDFPLYTKYMMELKKGKGIMRIKDFHNPYKNDKIAKEMSLTLFFHLTGDTVNHYQPPEQTEFPNLIFEELDLDYIVGLAEYNIPQGPDNDFIASLEDDAMDLIDSTSDENIEVEDDVDLEGLDDL